MIVMGKMWVGNYDEGFRYMTEKYGNVTSVHCNPSETEKVHNGIPNKTLKVGQYIFVIQ